MCQHKGIEHFYLLKLVKELRVVLDLIHLAWFLAKVYVTCYFGGVLVVTQSQWTRVSLYLTI